AAGADPHHRSRAASFRGGSSVARYPGFPQVAVMQLLRFVTVLMVLSSPLAAADDPASAVNAFYAVYKDHHAQGGIPDATGRVRYTPVLSPRLNKQLTEAAAA